MNWIKVRGVLVYDPVRFNFKKKHKERTLIVRLPRDDLISYYQWWLRKQHGTWFDHELHYQKIFDNSQRSMLNIPSNVPQINNPMWGAHVTIVRGDEVGFKSPKWKAHVDEKIEIYYQPTLTRAWKFWSMPVKSDNLSWMRHELGLSTKFNFHITVAREM